MANANSSEEGRYQVEETIKTWLVEEGWSLTEQTQPELRFAIVAQDEAGRKLIVGQENKRPDRIVIQASVTYGPDDQKRFNALPQKKRREFLWELRFDLLQMDVEFGGLSEPLQRVSVSQLIFYDALLKDAFMQRLSEVKKALLLIMWKVAQLMEEPPPQMGFIKG